jgi:hypothetical protein
VAKSHRNTQAEPLAPQRSTQIGSRSEKAEVLLRLVPKLEQAALVDKRNCFPSRSQSIASFSSSHIAYIIKTFHSSRCAHFRLIAVQRCLSALAPTKRLVSDLPHFHSSASANSSKGVTQVFPTTNFSLPRSLAIGADRLLQSDRLILPTLFSRRTPTRKSSRMSGEGKLVV